MLDAARRQRPRAAGHGELPVLRAAAEAQGDRRVGRDRRGQRLPPEDGGAAAAAAGTCRRAATSGSSSRCSDGRGILVFDDGWHKLATALWLFGPIREVRAWVGGTEVVPGVDDRRADRRSSWEHDNGIRGVWDITLAPDMYLRSDYYTNDERWEVTGRQGLRPRQPLHRPRHPAAEPRGLRRRRDARLPRARRRLGEQLPRLRPPLAALAAHRRGPAAVERRGGRRRAALRARRLRQQRGRRVGVDPASV